MGLYKLMKFILIVVVFSNIMCGCSSNLGKHKKLLVYIVGGGIKTKASRSTLHQTPLAREEGKAMYEGAFDAFQFAPECKFLHDMIIVRGIDDGESEQVAKDSAKRLQKNPRVLAIIGHSTSATTIAAAPYYAASGIPLLMPIATSPRVSQFKGIHLGNTFRLVPNDSIAQGPAIAYVAMNILNGHRIAIISDHSIGADRYSQPLTSMVYNIISRKGRIYANVQVSRENSLTIESSVRELRSQNPDVIIFCGYGSTAQDIFGFLREMYLRTSLQLRPKIILSDGCKINDLNTKGFRVFLTFPYCGVEDKEGLADVSGTTWSILERIGVTKDHFGSYQIFGYDAMLVLAKSIQEIVNIGKPLNRKSLINNLRSVTILKGIGDLYFTLRHGENKQSKYVLYSTGPLSTKLQVKSIITPYMMESILK